VTLLESVVLRDVVQVVTTNDNGTLHLRAVHNTLEDTATDGDVASERTFLVDVRALNRLLRRAEAQTKVLVPSGSAGLGGGTANEDANLLLVRTLDLFSDCRRHVCTCEDEAYHYRSS